MNIKNSLYISMLLIAAGLVSANVSYADDDSSQGFTEQSTDIGPQTVVAELGSGYVLETGSYTLYCRTPPSRWNTNCDYSVSSTQCPIGYSPEATVAPIWNAYRADDELRGYFLSPTATSSSGPGPSGPLIPTDDGKGGYKLHFATAYANFVAAEDEYLTISYSIYCLPQH